MLDIPLPCRTCSIHACIGRPPELNLGARGTDRATNTVAASVGIGCHAGLLLSSGLQFLVLLASSFNVGHPIRATEDASLCFGRKIKRQQPCCCSLQIPRGQRIFVQTLTKGRPVDGSEPQHTMRTARLSTALRGVVSALLADLRRLHTTEL